MTVRSPRVSVGLPVYNGEKYLPNALTGLLQQTFGDFELIISDNASTDATQEICREFAARDKRIRYHRNETNIGLAANHNRAFMLSHGEFFKWAAHDDDFPQEMLRRFVTTFDQSSPSVSLVYSHCEYINEFGVPDEIDSDGVNCDDPTPHRRLAWFLDTVHMYNCTYGLIRSDMLRKTRLHGLYPMCDCTLFAELVMLGTFVEIQEPLLRIRRHSGRTFTRTLDPVVLRELFNPGHGRDFHVLSMRVHMELELVRSALLIPTTLRDKVRCAVVASVVPHWRNFRAYGGRQKQKLRKLVFRNPTPSVE
jgi:glycosyltransferase involved in cell wall biosynthesis